ncbi:MAG: glycosyltransferase, partial [Planctomycetota bacterium]
EFCAERGVPYVAWEIDPSTERVPPVSRPVPDAHVHTYRRAHVEEYRAAGFERVEYTPLAADVLARQPAETSGERPERYEVDLAFVGASMVTRGRQCRAEFLAHYRAWAEREGVDPDGVEAIVEALLVEQRAEPFDYRLSERLRDALGDFVEDHERRLATGETHTRLEALLGEVAAAEKRLNLIAGLGRFAPSVWGDDGWRAVEAHGAAHRGGAGHTHELNRVYSGARINLDIGRIYQSDIVTMRVFDVLACGGFALVEHSPALEELFEVGVELDAYRSVDELHAKVEHWLAHPEERRAVAQRGLQAVRERHAMQARLEGLLAPLAVAGIPASVDSAEA